MKEMFPSGMSSLKYRSVSGADRMPKMLRLTVSFLLMDTMADLDSAVKRIRNPLLAVQGSMTM